jgi:hypothetical protein
MTATTGVNRLRLVLVATVVGVVMVGDFAVEVFVVVILAIVSGVLVLSIIEIAISCWYLNHFSEILLRMLMIVIMMMSIPSSSIARLRIHNFIRPLFI